MAVDSNRLVRNPSDGPRPRGLIADAACRVIQLQAKSRPVMSERRDDSLSTPSTEPHTSVPMDGRRHGSHFSLLTGRALFHSTTATAQHSARLHSSAPRSQRCFSPTGLAAPYQKRLHVENALDHCREQ